MHTHKEVDDYREQAFKKKMKDWRFKEEQKRRRKEEQQYQQSYKNYYKQQKQKESYAKTAARKLISAYIILGIKKGASLKEVKKAYRIMAHKHHPDKVAHLGEGSVKQAEIVFIKIKDAYELIIKLI